MYMSIIPAFWGRRQKNGEFEANLGYIVRPGFKTHEEARCLVPTLKRQNQADVREFHTTQDYIMAFCLNAN